MGNYINNNLIKDEYLIYETNYHWILYFNNIFLTLFTTGIYPFLVSKYSEFAEEFGGMVLNFEEIDLSTLM